MAGNDSGKTIVRKIRSALAPSTLAASISDSGSWAMKLCSRNTASGSENAVCVSQISARVPFRCRFGKIGMFPMWAPCRYTFCSGTNAIWIGTTCRANRPKKMKSLPLNRTQART